MTLIEWPIIAVTAVAVIAFVLALAGNELLVEPAGELLDRRNVCVAGSV